MLTRQMKRVVFRALVPRCRGEISPRLSWTRPDGCRELNTTDGPSNASVVATSSPGGGIMKKPDSEVLAALVCPFSKVIAGLACSLDP